MFVRNRRDGLHRISRSIIGIQEPLSYLFHVSTGDTWQKHIDDIHDRLPSTQIMPTDSSDAATSEDGDIVFMPDVPRE